MKSSLLVGICLSLTATVSMLNDVRELPWWSVKLGWTLVHSTWQLTIISLVAALLNFCLSRRSANSRYFASVAALFAVVVVPCWTWSLIPVPVSKLETNEIARHAEAIPQTSALPVQVTILEPIKGDSSEIRIIPAPDQNPMAEQPPMEPGKDQPAKVLVPSKSKPPESQEAEPRPQSPWFSHVQVAIAPWLGFIDTFWIVGVLLLSIRPVWGLWMQFRLRRIGLSSVPENLRVQLQQLAQRMGVSSAIKIAVSTLAKVPMVVGYMRPMILLPASVLTGLTPVDLESLLAHELAHIRRHDWVVNALQVVVETLLFYHPAVWWLSHQIRHERELCCDDLALAVIRDKARYGRMLLALEELLHHSSTPALAATGGNLVYRIRRLLPAAKPQKRSFNGWLTALVLLVLMGLAGGFSILNAKTSPADKPQPVEVDPNDETLPDAVKEIASNNLLTNESALEKDSDMQVAGSEDSQAPMSVALAISSHSRELREPLIDVGHMSVHESHWYSSPHATRLYQDRWLRARGFGDLFRDDDENWIAFRGARMLLLETENLDEAASIPLDVLKSRISAEGRIVIPDEEFKSKCLAIQTAEGQVAVGQFIRPFPWSVKLDLRQLTTDQQARRELPNDGVESAVWGPVIDGLQAGIVYRVKQPKPKMELMIGDMVMVKLFVRNASNEQKTYAWQLVDHFWHFKGEERSERELPHLPMLESWQPKLVGDDGTRAIISPLRDHRHFLYQKADLNPGEAVLVGTAGTTLWSAIDVDFGTSEDWLNAVQVKPGEYRLSSELDSGLVNGPKLQTGELSLQVVETEPERAKVLQALDSLSSVRRNLSYGDQPWEQPNSATEQSSATQPPVPARRSRRRAYSGDDDSGKPRPLLHRSTDEYLVLPGLVFDESTKKAVEGADVEITVEADAESRSDDLCQYHVMTGADGRFVARIPRKLLSGYPQKFTGTVRATVSHPAYCKIHERADMNSLRSLGLIDKNGEILKQGTAPESAKSTKRAEIQLIALRPARTISGRLLGPGNLPLPNTQITAYERTWVGFPSVLSLEYTDTDGYFRFNVPVKIPAHLEFQSFGLPTKKLTVAANQTELGNLLNSDGQQIRGKVLDAKGEPVAFVSMTAPPVPRPDGELVSVFKTNEKGEFESDLLQPGEYRLVVGEIRNPDKDRQRGGLRASGPPPDLYVDYHFKVEPGIAPADVTLRPATSVLLTSRLISTVSAIEEKKTDAFDVMLVKNVLENSVKTTEKNADAGSEQRPKLTITADADTGKISVKGDPDNQWALTLGFLCSLADSPYVVVKGTINNEPWTASTDLRLFGEDSKEADDQEPPKSKQDPHFMTLKIPRNVENLTLESGYPIHHVQIGSGPKLFGKSFRVPKLNTDQLEVKIYHYKGTTLRLHLVDQDGKPVVMPENKLPENLSVKVRYSREDEVRKAGAIIEPLDENATLMISNNEVFQFVLPEEEIEVTVDRDGKKVSRQFTLKDGETRIAELKLAPNPEWIESSKPTPKVEFEE